jgi:hypothetical protein
MEEYNRVIKGRVLGFGLGERLIGVIAMRCL